MIFNTLNQEMVSFFFHKNKKQVRLLGTTRVRRPDTTKELFQVFFFKYCYNSVLRIKKNKNNLCFSKLLIPKLFIHNFRISNPKNDIYLLWTTCSS